MFRHRTLAAVAAAATLTITLVGCRSGEPAVTARRSNTTPIAYPNDGDVALLRDGGAYAAPGLVIGGDGWVYQQTTPLPEPSSIRAGHITRSNVAIAVPAPPAPTPFERRKLSADGVQIVLALAEEKGLLEHQEYDAPGVTDMGTTSLTLTDDDGVYEHDAYALGFEDETGNRRDLLDFLTEIGDIEGLVGSANIGRAQPWIPTMYVVSINGSYSTNGLQTDWPKGVPVEEGCIALPVERFAPGVAGVYIADIDGTQTRVAVVPALPGDGCR